MHAMVVIDSPRGKRSGAEPFSAVISSRSSSTRRFGRITDENPNPLGTCPPSDFLEGQVPSDIFHEDGNLVRLAVVIGVFQYLDPVGSGTRLEVPLRKKRWIETLG
ncbi:MAG: hypothetical protein U1D30_14390 [Planctomycetota bacterium]